jgi:hypothetical protein
MSKLVNTWNDYCQFLGEQLQRIVRLVPREVFEGLHRHEALFELLFQLNADHRKNVDAIIRGFIATGDLPELEGIERYLLGMRFFCAIDTLNIMLVGDSVRQIVPDPRGTSREQILEWLLISTWHEWRSDLWLKAEGLRVHGPTDSFYSLGE